MRIFYTVLCGLLLVAHFASAQNCPPRPAAAPKLINNDICIGQPISVLNLSNANGNDVYYVWEWGDGSKPDTLNDNRSPVHIYERAANDACSQPRNGYAYKIKLTVKNRNPNCLDHSTITDVYAYFTPEANFTMNDACIDDPVVTFENTTCALNTPGTQIIWTFGDPASGSNNTSTEVNPTHRYPSTGTYDVTLKVISFCSTTEKKMKVTVHEKPIIGFAIPSMSGTSTACAPYVLAVQNTSADNLGGVWKISPATGWRFKEGYNEYSRDPVIRFEEDGEYTISYDVKTPCGIRTFTHAQKVTVKSKPKITVDALPTSCAPFSVSPKGKLDDDGGLAVKYQWKIEGGSISSSTNFNPGSILFEKTGTFRITLQAENTCGLTAYSENLVIVDKAKVEFTFLPDTLCSAMSPVQLKALPAGGKWTGAGVSATGLFDPSLVTEGEYNVRYSIADGACADTKEATIEVFSSVNDSLPNQLVCANQGTPVALTANSPSQRSGITNGIWSGEGIVDARKGIFSPTTAGTGTFKLTCTYADVFTGCPNTITQNMVVKPKPQAAIETVPTTCANDVKKFTHKAIGATRFIWHFGDGETDETEQPTHVYPKDGEYAVKLITFNENNCADTAITKVKIIPNLKAEIAANTLTGCAPLAVKFQNKTNNTDGKFTWDFGNGRISHEMNPSTTMLFDNNTSRDTQYTVKLTVVRDGCSANSTTTKINVSSPPISDFGLDVGTGCAPLAVQFANVSSGSPKSYFWDFGNGQTSTEANPDIQKFDGVVGKTKEYTIKLISSNICGHDTTEQKVVVKASETKAFFKLDKLEGCAPLSINLEGIVSQGVAVQYDLGDGNFSNKKKLAHTFTKPGTYKIRQMASGSCGQDSVERLVYVWDTPSAKFTTAQSNNCNDRRIQFNQATTKNVEIAWDMGDGTQLENYNPLHDYGQKGDFMVKLSVKDLAHGCSNTDSALVSVRSPLSFDFDSIRHSGCYGFNTGAMVVRKDDIKNASGIIEFSLNDSTFTKDINLSGVFSNLEGRRWHTIWVRDKSGCIDSTSAYINGFPPLAIDAGPDREIELGDSTHTAVTTNAYKLLDIKWNQSKSISCDTCADVFLKPRENTLYTVTATGPEGCTAEAHVSVHVKINHRVYVPNVFSPNGDGMNDYFYPNVTKHVQKVAYFRVYTRWGEQVFENKNFLPDTTERVGWDGIFRNDQANTGVYVWVMEIELLNGNRELYKGDVTLMR
jgi:gliding motility-associated-like protein